MVKRDKSRKYDITIIGAGPAGIFAALELARKNNLKILMIEKGSSIEKRSCPVASGKTAAHVRPAA